MSDTQAYTIAPDDMPVDDPLPAPFAEFLITRRRSLITELRQIELLLRLPQSIPPRKRPH
jgi:hypothetical protein